MLPNTDQIASHREKGWFWLLVLISFVGFALRVAKAWTGQFSPNSDFGIVALMAKHMAEGRDFPVFFYGQPYMGSLEPAFSALLCKLFGVSGFVVRLGTAVLSACLLPLVYLFARDASSRRAGVMAALFCLVGSDTILHYSVAPRGGYMTMLVSGLLVLWLAARIAAYSARGEAAPPVVYAAAGLAAGLGWWSTQLVTAFLGTAAVLALCAFRPRLLRHGFLPASTGFVAGSLPWWLWNLTHQWTSLEFASSLGKTPAAEGWRSFGKQLLKLLELWPLSNSLAWLRTVSLIGLSIYFLWILIADRLRTREVNRFYHRLAIPVLFAVMALIYVTSHYAAFHETRYLLPLFPAVAIMLGVVCDQLQRRFRLPLGWALLILLLPRHLYEVGQMRHDRVKSWPTWRKAVELTTEVGPLCGGVCWGGYALHWINFASDERLCVAGMPAERYAPYAALAETAPAPAVLADHRRIRAFLEQTQGHSRQTVCADIPVDYAITAPSDHWNYVDDNVVLRTPSAEQAEPATLLTDALLDTCWYVPEGSDSSVVFCFARPVKLCGVRLLSPDDHYPRRVTLEARKDSDKEWQTILPKVRPTGYFWSGVRLQLEGLQFFQEFRFATPSADVCQVRLTVQSDQGIRLGEVLFLEQEEPRQTGAIPTVETCWETLRKTGAQRVYAPRWLSEELAVLTRGTVRTSLPRSLTRSVQDLPKTESACPEQVLFNEPTALLMDTRDAPRTKKMLNLNSIPWQEFALGRYLLLLITPPPQDQWGLSLPILYWTELGAFGISPAKFVKRRAQAAFEQAARASNPIPLLRNALSLYPAHQAARRTLIQALATTGEIAEATANAAILQEQTVPEIPAPVRFANGVELLGFRASANTVPPGGTVQITYYWRVPENLHARDWAVFVHFIGPHGMFQDDRLLVNHLDTEDIAYQPFAEVFTEKRLVRIPSEQTPGEYRLHVGLCRRSNGERVRVRTKLQTRRRAVATDLTVLVRTTNQTDKTKNEGEIIDD